MWAPASAAHRTSNQTVRQIQLLPAGGTSHGHRGRSCSPYRAWCFGGRRRMPSPSLECWRWCHTQWARQWARPSRASGASGALGASWAPASVAHRTSNQTVRQIQLLPAGGTSHHHKGRPCSPCTVWRLGSRRRTSSPSLGRWCCYHTDRASARVSGAAWAPASHRTSTQSRAAGAGQNCSSCSPCWAWRLGGRRRTSSPSLECWRCCHTGPASARR